MWLIIRIQNQIPSIFVIFILWPWPALSSSIPTSTIFPPFSPLSLSSLSPSMAAATSTPLKSISSLVNLSPLSSRRRSNSFTTLNSHLPTSQFPGSVRISFSRRRIVGCQAAEVSVAEQSPASDGGSGGDDGKNWVPVVPLAALPKGERRVIIQDGETILLLWYKNEVFAIENRSPAEGAYSEGLLNAKLTQDGCIVCPTTDSTFDLRTGEIKEWYPNNPVLRVLTPPLRSLYVYPLKTDDKNIYISIGSSGGVQTGASTEIVFSGKAQPGQTATDVNVDEVKMVVDESLEGFGFTSKNEVINGKAAVIGFLLLLDFELLTGKGLLKGTGFLDFLYSVTDAFK